MPKLTYRERQRLHRNQFAEPKERKYPIEDEAHARNALARVSAHGSPHEKHVVRSAVHKTYPQIQCSMCGSLHHSTHEHRGMDPHHDPTNGPTEISMEHGMMTNGPTLLSKRHKELEKELGKGWW